MFYEKYMKLCQKAGKRPYAVSKELGLGSSNVAQWQKGSTPRPQVLQKIADYFGVSVAYLMGDDEPKETPLVNGDQELTDYLEMLKTRPECRMLFQLTKNATKEDVEAAVRIIEALRNK